MKTKLKFKRFAEKSTLEFSLLKNIMKLKKEEVPFLRFMHNLLEELHIDLQQRSPQQDTPIIIVIHLPHCPDSHKDTLIRYMIYKSALLQNRATLDRFQRSTAQPVKLCSDTGRRETLKSIETHKHLKKVCREVESFEQNGVQIPDGDGKSLLIARETDFSRLAGDKKDIHLHEYMADINSAVAYTRNVLTTTDDSYDLVTTIKNGGESFGTIQQILLFHSPNRMNVLKSYNIDQLRRLNARGLGIKRMIVFSLTPKPMNLYKTIENRKRRFLTALYKRNMQRYDDSDTFITFTAKELYYLFGRNENQQTFLADIEDGHLFAHDLEEFLDDIPRNYKIRNLLSISFNTELQEEAASILSRESSDFSNDEYHPFFSMLRRLWDNHMHDKISDFLSNCTRTTFVVSSDTPQIFKEALKDTFEGSYTTISFCNLDQIGEQSRTEKFVVFQYRSANSRYTFYPNTFDPLPIKSNQQALVVVNMLTHGRQYEWDNLNYRKGYNGLLYSRFRSLHLGWTRKEFIRLEYDLDEFIEAEYSETTAKSNQREKCSVYYKNGSMKELDINEHVIYEIEGKNYIKELRYILEYTNFRMELLDDVANQVKVLINEKTKESGDAEQVIRSDPKHQLTSDEVQSVAELWKILLQKRVEKHGEDVVYEAIFKNIPADDRVSLATFRRWHNPEGGMILPRSRKHRRAVLEYLEFTPDSHYYRLIVMKKLISINDTKSLNSRLENLLKEILFMKKISSEFYNILNEKYDDLFILLEISSPVDVEALLGLIDMEFDEVKYIEYG